MFIAGILVACAASVISQPGPGVTVPDSPAGKRLTAFVKAFNSGEDEQRLQFILDHYTSSEDSVAAVNRRMEIFGRLFADLGGLDLWEIRESEPLKLTLTAKARQPQADVEWVELSLELDTLPPHRLVRMGFRPAEDPTEVIPDGPLSDHELTAYLTSYLDKLAAEDRFSGTVLVAKDGQPIFAAARGDASKRFGVANRLDTKFNLGSMNKMFTGVAIVQLAQQGRLSFDDPVAKHVPDYPNQEVAEKVTIHHLLTHTSGMESYWEELFEADWPSIRTVQQVADLFVDKPLLFEPGDRFHYSNSGPIVLGLIIERISGMSYYDYIREHVYKPASMANTDCFEMDKPVPNLAIGYTKMRRDGGRDEQWRNNLFLHTVKGGPAGGGFSTVEDLLAFANALTDHKLLSPAYTDTLITGKVSMGPEAQYAYMFGDEIRNGHRVIGHNGGAPGISAVLDIYIDLGYTVAVLSNYDMVAETVARRIGRLIAD